MSKISRKLLKEVKNQAKSSGNDLKKNKKGFRAAKKDVRKAIREEKISTGEVKWNLNVGDLIELKKKINGQTIGFISKLDFEHARKINDYSQVVEIITHAGKLHLHPKYVKLLQRA